MSITDLLTMNQETLDFTRQALLEVYGTDYSEKQIREAFTIALLTIEVFQEVITKLQREKYCGQQKHI